MATSIDELQIEIKGTEQDASESVTRLVEQLGKISDALNKLDATELYSLSIGVTRLGTAMQTMSGIKTTEFSRLVRNINKMGEVDVNAINTAATSFTSISNSLNGLGSATTNAQAIADMANGISKLGGANVQKAVANMPELAASLSNLMLTLSRAPKIRKSVVDMTNALANLSAQGSRVGVASKNIERGLNRASTSATSASKSFNGLASAFGKLYATYFLFIRGAKSIWDDVESAMDYVETYNYYSVALNKIGSQFGEQFEEFGYDSADAYVESFNDRLAELNQKLTGYTIGDSGELLLGENIGLGMDIEQMMNFQAKTLAVTNSVGLLGETSINTAKAISMLAGDLSSLTNTDLESVMTNLSSGLIGQSRALYKYGIDITANTLQQYALAEGIDKAVAEMTQSEKMQLRLLAILDQSSVAHSDLANTINSVANQYRISQQQIGNLGRTIGNLFLPIVKNVLPYVNGLIIAVNELFTTLGFELYGDTWLEDLQDGVSGGVQEGLEDLEDGADGAAESIKELKKSVRAFDELKTISISTTSNSSGILGELEGQIDLTQSISDAVADYEKAWDAAFTKAENKASEFAKTIKKTFYDENGNLSDFSIALSGIAGAFTTIAAVKGLEGVANGVRVLMASLTGHPYVAIAAGVGGLATALWAWSERNYTELNKDIDDAKKAVDGINEVSNKVKETIDGLNAKEDASLNIVDKYFDLLENPNVSWEEKEDQLKAYVSYLTKEFPELADTAVDKHTGLFKLNKEEIIKNIQALTEYAKTAAKQDLLIEAYTALYKAQAEMADLREEAEALNNREKTDFEKWNAPNAVGSLIDIFTTKKRAELAQTIYELNEAIKESEDLIASLEADIQNYSSIDTATSSTAYEKIDEQIQKTSDNAENTSQKINELAKTNGEMLENLSSQTDATVKAQGKSTEDSVKSVSDAIITETQDANEEISASFEKTTELVKNNVVSIRQALSELEDIKIDIPIYFTTNANEVFGKLGAFNPSPNFDTGLITQAKSALTSSLKDRINITNQIKGNEDAITRDALLRIADKLSGTTNVNVTLEGDASDIFRVVQNAEEANYKRTGKSTFVH